ncbi:MAG: hypothetical protein ACYC9L_16270 [Sulfuricaulis sp.]
MKRIRITYADHNTEIERQLPLNAELLEKISLEGSSHEWWLVALERPLSHVGIEFPYALVASRWEGHPLSGPEPTSAFLLLSQSRTLPSPPSVSSFPHVAWCSVNRCVA